MPASPGSATATLPPTSAKFPPLPVDSSRLTQRPARRVYNILRSAIRTGAMDQDEQLVEFRLIRSMRESRAAVREAMRMLAEEGLLTRERRVGTRVARDIIRIPVMDEVIPIDGPTLNGLGDQERTVIYQLERRMVIPPEPVYHALSPRDGRVLMLDQLILLDGETIGARTTYISVDHTSESVLQAVTGSTHHPLAYGPLFRALFNQDVGRSDFTIESIASGERTSGLLDIPFGSPLLLVETLLRGTDEVPRLLSYAHLTSNRLALFVSGSAPSA
ncbi:MAG TPA: GntR family transcriptional regulator [Pseudonocardia sp.]|uniref:GntR family transcriptional regulator n=1 Tax=Pseudonocardia sp. TaxID=60912 RepID=UPI002C24D949|nr:GntR family transcriptional regulator [Pseudonocardia sp.]HTF55000.1 GntR family transcriptional regulator [Pseudonocardia sp.]